MFFESYYSVGRDLFSGNYSCSLLCVKLSNFLDWIFAAEEGEFKDVPTDLSEVVGVVIAGLEGIYVISNLWDEDLRAR